MKPILIVGNWKSNKTIGETDGWLQKLSASLGNRKMPATTQIVLCAPFTVLSTLKTRIAALHLPIAVGAQDVSPFPKGAYTGEVNAQMIKELASWVIIGHSERRNYFKETDEELVFEVKQAKQAGIKVIFCVSREDMMVPYGVDAIAYEPIESIGTGENMDPKKANEVLASLKKKTNSPIALYGGSVAPENVIQYVNMPGIDGVLVGGASLDSEAFLKLIISASSV